MKDIVLFPSSDPSLFYYEDLVGKKVIETKINGALRYKNRKILIYVKNYEADYGIIKVVSEKGKAAFLINLGDIIYSEGEKRAKNIFRIRRFLTLYPYPSFALATFAKREEDVRDEREKAYIGMLLGLGFRQALEGGRKLEEYL